MFVMFKKRIVVDTFGEEIRRVTNLLDQHGIRYELRTKRTRGALGTGFDVGQMPGRISPCLKGVTAAGG